MVTGAATAPVNRIPVFLLPGDIFALQRRTGSATGVATDSGYFRERLVQAGFSLLDRISRPQQLFVRRERHFF
jgi:TPP-dependent trihydroxycyclohexane-1,2-dione (THcHDO) dehydratase